MRRLRSHRNRKNDRAGAAVVELAVCLPALLLLVVASIESCNMVFVEQSLSIASYEGIRTAIKRRATDAQVLASCEEILENRNVADATVTITPVNLQDTARGQQIVVRITAPCDKNTVTPPWFFGGRMLSSESTMVKE